MDQSRNLLDESLGLVHEAARVSLPSGKIVLIEDCVEMSGAFVLHHLIKRSLPVNSSAMVIFVAFARPLSHYERILKKLGCNLALQKQAGRFIFLDMLKMECPGEFEGSITQSGLFELFQKIYKAVEISCSPENQENSITIMIDDLSLVEVAAHGSSSYVLDFLHYCHTLTSDFGCTLVLLNHDDIYSNAEDPTFNLEMEYLADIVIKAKPLATGLATDVHGQLTVLNKEIMVNRPDKSIRTYSFQFKVKENIVEYFYSGNRI